MRNWPVLLLFFGLSTSCVENPFEVIQDSDNVELEAPTPVLPEPVPVETPDDLISRYPFLEDDNFWAEFDGMQGIPNGKSCRNNFSYAEMGAARIAWKYINDSFAMFPFGGNYLYYRFPDNVSPSNPKRYEVFGVDPLFEILERLNQILLVEIGRPITLTGITKHLDDDHDLHCRHRSGTIIDVRPFPGFKPVTWRPKDYDREMNKTLILTLIDVPELNVIFFNDPELLSDSDILAAIEARDQANNPVVFRRVSGHDNHLHVEFKNSFEIQRVVDYILEQRPVSGVFSAEREYSQH
ncbi:MAG: hypothetical protein AB8E15_07900 [Bdellovibrionales bacterium]